MEWNFDNVKYNGKDLDRVQVDGVTVWEKPKPKFYDYLQNDGVAYINTNIISTVNTGIKVTYSYTTSGSAAIAGIFNNSIPRTDTLFISSNSGTINSPLFTAHRGITKTFDNISLNTKYIAEINYLNSGYMGFGNDKVAVGSNRVYNYPILLFARYNVYNDNITASNSKIYSAVITEGETIIHDFRPCEYNGKYGLWDLVENKFYGNANSSGAFTVGSEIKYYNYLGLDGNSWIDTGLKGNLSTEANIKFTPKINELMNIFGAGSGNNNKCVAIARDSTNSYLFAQFGSITGTIQRNIVLVADDYYDITLNNTSYIVNGILARTFSDTNPFTTENNLLIGKIINFDKSNYTGLVYGCTIKDNGVLVRDYKPCLYNGEAGLWDSVECKFYGNSNNTGTLTVGNDE